MKNINVKSPLYIRLPKTGHQCQYTGLSRTTLNTLILDTSKETGLPLVKSVALKKRPSDKRGIRLIEYSSLRDFLSQKGESTDNL